MEASINQISQWFYNSLIKNRNAIFGFSILYIIFFHSGFNPLFGRGYIGVDIFLFLSAFGLCFSLEKHSLLFFYLRRLNRIYPLFVISNLLKYFIEWYQGVEISVWDSICDITGLTFFGIGGTHLLWFIPSLMVLYILTPLLYHILNKYKNKVFFLIAVSSLIVMLLFKEMDWHYACFVSRVPSFSLGLLYYVQRGNIHRLFPPLLTCVILEEVAVANELKFSVAAFYVPVLLFFLCFFIDRILKRSVGNLLSWIGSKSLEFFIGNGMATAFFIGTGIVNKALYYILANIIWIIAFIFINKLLPSNGK